MNIPFVSRHTDIEEIEPHVEEIAFALVVVFSMCSLAWSQMKTGTIVVVSSSKHKVVMAADSRVNFGDGRYEDSYCKIAALNDKLIFAATGIVGDNSYLLPEDLRFGATEEARKAARTFDVIPDFPVFSDQPRVHRIATDWGQAMARRFNAASDIRLKHWLELISKTGERAFVLGIFAGLERDGRVSVAVAHVDYGSPMKGFIVSPASSYLMYTDITDIPETTSYGMPEIVHNISEGKTDFAKVEQSGIRELRRTLPPDKLDRYLVIRLVDLTIAFHPKQEFVGGKIDAIELREGGTVQWIQRKDTCPDR